MLRTLLLISVLAVRNWAFSASVSSEADKKWEEIEKKSEIAEPNLATISIQELNRLAQTERVKAAGAANRAQEFYLAFPDHPKAAEARRLEIGLLEASFFMGNTNAFSRLSLILEPKVLDRTLKEDERSGALLKLIDLESLMEAKAFDLAQQVRNLEVLERGLARYKKEFPESLGSEILTLDLAKWSKPARARELLKTLSNNPEASSILGQMGRCGKKISLHFEALEGKEIDMSSFKGKVVLIEFWATWCPPCVVSLLQVKRCYEQFHARGLEVIGISFDEKRSALERFLKSQGLNWPHYFSEHSRERFPKEFGVEAGYPTTWLVDKEGILRSVLPSRDLNFEIEQLLAEKMQ